MSTATVSELQEHLVKFMIEWDIPFKAINSTHLHAFLKLCRPAFPVPDETALSTDILQKVYESAMSSVKKRQVSYHTLILTANTETGKVIAYTKPLFQKTVFLCEVEAQNGFDNLVTFQSTFNTLTEEAKFQFNAIIISIVQNCLHFEDLESFALKDFTFTCHLKLLEIVSIRASEPDLRCQIEEILSVFQIQYAFERYKWKEEFEIFNYYCENLNTLKQEAIHTMIQQNIREKLYDNDLHKKVERARDKLGQLVSVANNSQYLHVIMTKWFELYTSTSLIIEGEVIFDQIFTSTNIAAYALDPRNKDKSLSARQNSKLRFCISKLLKCPEEYEKFDEYMDNKGEFNQDELNGISIKEFWTLMKGYCPKLSQIAINLTSLPATTVPVHHSPEKQNLTSEIDPNISRKLAFIKSSF